VVLALSAGLPTVALGGHGVSSFNTFDHDPPPFASPPAPGTGINSGGEGASWELLDTITTGNPHTDIDFFTQDGDTYLSAGTLGNGPNSGGQTIVKLTDGGAVSPELVSSQPSASCVSDPSAATGLQHDVEATPKGGVPLNIRNPYADGRDAQLLIDATDAPGRCHDQGTLGVGAPQGGLEIIDITDVANPVEIGLTSHIGESHTVNIDPKRPHIAYSVTSDNLGLEESGRRNNERGTSFALDGFEVVDFSSCMGFAPATSIEDRRDACKPKVYRYRYPNARMALGHTDTDDNSAIFGCHELEVYPSDLLTCGSGNTLIGLDMSRAFKTMGTPDDFTDDRPRGKPLPCTRRDSTSAPPFSTGARITDCVDGQGEGMQDLSVGRWLRGGHERLRGVRWLGSIYHQGGGPQNTPAPYPSAEDVAFNHEAELTASGRYLLATDERGGGVLPPGAACSPGADNPEGNGGLHAYRFGKLRRNRPNKAKTAWRAYARTKQGEKAIFRAPINTGPQGSLCTAHVFQQIPGQNRIFMGWYSQGTHVVDFKERRTGRLKFIDAGYLIPENANTWVSHIFDWERNPDGTFTYLGATGDFNLGSAGRSSIDIFRATLPAPPKPRRPTDALCERLWGQLHDRAGRPFSNGADCRAFASRR
jgi:hypothetical protein